MKLVGWALFACALLAPGAVVAQDEDDCNFTVGRYGSAEISVGCEKALAAMAGDKDRADLLYRLGYAMIENDAVLGSLDVLRRAVALAPGNAGYWHELGFAQADLGMYAEALASLDRAVTLDPQHANAINERGWVRQKLGDFAGANEDYDRYFAIEGESAGTRLSHARNLVWLGKLDEAEAALALIAGEADLAEDVAKERALIARIRAYRPTGNEAQVCEVSEALSDKARAEVVFDACTRAFLDSSNPEQRADFLTARGTARQTIEDTLGIGYGDLSVAAGLDPHNGRRYVNTGFALLSLQHSWAARNDFDRALELGLPQDLQTAIALAGRAQANLNLDERDAALDDARRSFELEPTEVSTAVLGAIASADGDKDLAREMWLAAYRLGGRDDGLMENLRSVGVDDPETWRDDDET